MKIVNLLFIVVVWMNVANAQPGKQNANTKAPSASNQVTETPQAISPIEAVTNTSAESEAYRKERDAKDDTFRTKQTEQNEVIKNATFWIAIITGCNLFLAIVFAIFGGLQWRAVLRQGAIMERQLEAADRPWLRVDVESVGPLTFDNSCTFDVQLIAKNVGRSVAVNATVTLMTFVPPLVENFDTITGDDMWAEVVAKQTERCKNINSKFMSFILFPDREYSRSQGLAIRKEDFGHGQVSPEFIRFYILGCADYQVSGHERHHQTRFIYEVLINVVGGYGGVMPIEKLTLKKPSRDGADYAD